MAEKGFENDKNTSPAAFSQTEIAPAKGGRPELKVLRGGLDESPLDKLKQPLREAISEAKNPEEAAANVARLIGPRVDKLNPTEALALEFSLKLEDLQNEPALAEVFAKLKQIHGNEPKEDPIAAEQKKLGEATDTSQYLIEAIQGQDEAKRTSALGEARSRVGVWRKYIDSLPSELKTGPDARDFETIVHELEVEIKMDDEKKLGQARDKVEKA